MRRFFTLLVATGLVACGGGDYPADDEAGAEGMPAGIELADVAGTWNLTAIVDLADATPMTYSVTATDTDTGWTMTLPERDPLEIQILAIEGDSIVSQTGPFESLVREGVMVSTRTVMRLQDGMLVGTFVATYETDPVETMAGTFEGTRAIP